MVNREQKGYTILLWSCYPVIIICLFNWEDLYLNLTLKIYFYVKAQNNLRKVIWMDRRLIS